MPQEKGEDVKGEERKERRKEEGMIKDQKLAIRSAHEVLLHIANQP